MLLAAALMLGLVGVAVPARAADTPTATPLAGELSISAPGSVDLGSVPIGASQQSAHLGTVTVADTRGAVGVVTRIPGQLLAANAVTLATSRTAFSAILTVGNNTTSWNPTVIVTVPSSAVAGVYTATLTHSVA